MLPSGQKVCLVPVWPGSHVPTFLDGVKGFAAGVFLLVDFTVAKDLRGHVGRKCVDARYAHAVQSAGHFVGAFVELAACVQHGHDDFQGRFLFLLMEVDGDASAVVLDGDGVVGVDGYFDVVAIACHGFVDGVVHHFVDQVVQAVFTDVADIHGGTFAHGLQAFEHLDVAGRVVVLAHYLFFCCHTKTYFPNNRQK